MKITIIYSDPKHLAKTGHDKPKFANVEADYVPEIGDTIELDIDDNIRQVTDRNFVVARGRIEARLTVR